MKSVAIAIVFIVLGIIIGNAVENAPEPSTRPTKVVTVHRTVTKEVPKPYVPAACKEVPELSAKVSAAVGAYEKTLGRESLVQDQSYVAMNTRDQILLNRAEAEHRDIMNDTRDAALLIDETNGRLKTALSQCRDTMAK